MNAAVPGWSALTAAARLATLAAATLWCTSRPALGMVPSARASCCDPKGVMPPVLPPDGQLCCCCRARGGRGEGLPALASRTWSSSQKQLSVAASEHLPLVAVWQTGHTTSQLPACSLKQVRLPAQHDCCAVLRMLGHAQCVARHFSGVGAVSLSVPACRMTFYKLSLQAPSGLHFLLKATVKALHGCLQRHRPMCAWPQQDEGGLSSPFRIGSGSLPAAASI